MRPEHSALRMHELPVTESILNVALQHASGHEVERIVRIHLRIGELSDLIEEWMQRYFDHLSRQTLAEGAKLVIERAPIVLRCDACSRSFEVSREGLRAVQCPDCGESSCQLVSGREYLVKSIEVV